MIRPMGFGLAFGVLVDAFIVRMALTPASRATSRSVAMSFLPGPAAVLTILQTEVYR